MLDTISLRIHFVLFSISEVFSIFLISLSTAESSLLVCWYSFLVVLFDPEYLSIAQRLQLIENLVLIF